MSITVNQQLSAQLSHYIVDLENIRKHLVKSAVLPKHLKLLQQKILIKISHFQTAINQLRIKDHSVSTLKSMNLYFSNVFSQIVKQAHRFLQMKSSSNGQQKLNAKLNVLKQVENEMEDEWQNGQKTEQKSVMKMVGKNMSMLTQQINQGQLKSMAKDYLQKEFLAIRMVAYKMYQQYTAHSHPNLLRQIQQLRKEQLELSEQASEMNEISKNLKQEEKRLIRDLNQVKTVNDLMSKRYFVSGQIE